jgi:long-chain acyl-CoA synthetase
VNAAPQGQDRVLAARSARMAGLLHARGVGAGDCVAVALPPARERRIVVSGVARLGAVVAPLEPVDEPETLRQGMALAGATLLVAWHTLAEAAEAIGATVLFVAPGEFDRLLDKATPLP